MTINYKNIIEKLSENEIWDLLEIVDALESTDGFFTTIIIYDKKIKNFFEKNLLIDLGNRGSSPKRTNLLEFEELLYLKLDELEE